MNELYSILFSTEGRINRSWYIGLSAILFTLFFYVYFPFVLLWMNKLEHWSEYLLFITSLLIAGILLKSWVSISIKRLKDNDESGKDYFIPLLVMLLVWPVMGGEIFYYILLLLFLVVFLELASRKGTEGENKFGGPFQFVWNQDGIAVKKKPSEVLLKKLEAHQLYLQDKKQHQPVDFVGVDFRDMLLENINFNEADLTGANFEGASLVNSQFKKANITKASFVRVNLSNTNFEDCEGVDSINISQANLDGSNLAVDSMIEGVLAQIGEIARIAKPIFLGLLSACTYSLITIATIDDASIIVDSSNTTLPIIQVKIAVSGFFYATPWILFGIFLYFNLYLRKLWTELKVLPVILPNGKESMIKTYPWLLMSIGNDRVANTGDKQHYFKRMEVFICFLLAWWVVPFSIGYFGLQSLVRHDWWLSSWLIVALIVAGITALIYQRNTLLLLSKKEGKRMNVKLLWIIGLVAFYHILLYTYDGIIGIEKPIYRANLERAFLVEKPVGYFNDRNEDKANDIVGPDLSGCDLRYANARGVFGVQSIFVGTNMEGIILKNSCLTKTNMRGVQADSADFSNAELSGVIFGEISIDSVSYWQEKFQEESSFILVKYLRFIEELNFWQEKIYEIHDEIEKGVNNLRKFYFEKILVSMFSKGARLRNASFHSAKASEVNFIGVELNSANFISAQLGGAIFWKAKANSAIFRKIKADSVNFSYAELENADFSSAELEGSNFSSAELEGANFSYAELEGANFISAKLENADFGPAELEGSNFSSAELEGANFSYAKLEGANFSYAKLENADFGSAKLEGTDFSYAELEGANFISAKLGGAIFWKAKADSVNFSYAELENTDFNSAELEGSNFSSAELEGSNFSSAELEGCDFSYTQLKYANWWEANIKGATFKNVTLDSGLVHITTWLDSLETWNIIGAKELIEIYEIDTVKNYGSWDRSYYHQYYIKRKQPKKKD